MFELLIEEYFSGAHQLRNYQGKCENLHGHNWKVQVYLRAKALNDIGLAIDFKVIKKDLKIILDQVEHRFLNEVFPFTEINPSAENLAKWVYDGLSKKLNDENVNIFKVVVWESETSAAAFFEEEDIS